MTASVPISPELVARFRADAQRRLERIEAAWLALGQASGDRERARQAARELHTLKGDAHIIGFRDASLLCHKLEELFAAAERQQFRVGEEVDLAVTMAIGFLGMIIRRKLEAPVGGIDLPGFVQHIDALLGELAAGGGAVREPAPAGIGPGDDRDAVSARSRAQLAVIATELFLTALAADDATRSRLHATWGALVGQLDRLGAAPIDRALVRHAHAARRLAEDLGRAVDVEVEVGSELVGTRVLDALDDALGHIVRNAIDHGLRPAGERLARGKPARGRLRIAARVTRDRVEVEVADDGDGLDLDAIRARAIERGLLAAGGVSTRAALLELAFTPGFSTRDQVSELSGRGVGLDAVRAAVRAEGGEVELTTVRGVGTTLTLRLPHDEPGLEVLYFDAPFAGALVAVPAEWSAQPASGAGDGGAPEVDLGRFGVLIPAVAPRVVVSRGGEQVRLPARWPPRRAYAVRVCPSPADHAVEIVRIGDAHGVLVRPPVILAAHREPRPGTVRMRRLARPLTGAPR